MSMVKNLRFCLTLLCLAVSTCVFAQIVDGGNYYLKNNAADAYLAGSNSWGTQASLVKHAEYVTLHLVSDGVYNIESRVSNGGTKHFFNGSYLDDANALPVTFTDLGNATYKLTNGEQTFGYDGSTNILSNAATEDNAVWTLYTEEEMLATLTKANISEPVDATFLIKDPNFSRNNRAKNAWTVSADCTNKNLGGGENTNFCAESYHSTFNISQTLTVPNGVYALTAQGFYRQDGTDNENLPTVFANDAKEPFFLMAGAENSMTDASNAFTAGKYAIAPIFVEVKDSTLKVGVELLTNATLWCIWDNFELSYYGAEANIETLKNLAFINTLSGLIADAEPFLTDENVSKAAIEKVNAAVTAGRAELDNASATVATLQAAIDGLKAAISAAKLSVGNKLAIDAMYALLDATNVYSAETAEAYKAAADSFMVAWTADVLTSALENPYDITAWRADVTFDDMLMSLWKEGETAIGVQNWESLHVNTWSNEGVSDGSEFKVPFLEYWVADAETLAPKTFTATITGLTPNAKYNVSSATRVRMSNGATGEPKGISFVVGTDTDDPCLGSQVGTSQFYVEYLMASDYADSEGNLTVSYVVEEGNNISWLSFQNVTYERTVEVTTWNFTEWSEETKTNLKAEAANYTPASGDVTLWRSYETQTKSDDKVDQCYWYGETLADATLTANGKTIAETDGLLFSINSGGAMAIAVNYPTALNTYDGPQYLWMNFGGGKVTIPNVAPGSTITMVIETHKKNDARGLDLTINGTAVAPTSGNNRPKTIDVVTWNVSDEYAAPVNCVFTNNKGCHIYSIMVVSPAPLRKELKFVEVNEIAEIKDLDNGTHFKLNTEELKITRNSADTKIPNGEIIIEDASGAIILSVEETGIELPEAITGQGNVVNGLFIGTATTVSLTDTPMIIPNDSTVNSALTVDASAKIEPTLITLAEAQKPEHAYRYVKVVNVNFVRDSITFVPNTINDGTDTLGVMDVWDKLEYDGEELVVYDRYDYITGILTPFSEITLIMPCNVDDGTPAYKVAPQTIIAKKWDFTNWSEETKANLKAEAANYTPASGDVTLWRSYENKAKPDDKSDLCYWYGEAQTDATLTANGKTIAETDGLLFSNNNSGALAIAMDYQTSDVGSYNGPAYLWINFGGSTMTIPSVAPGSTITMVVETHRNGDARGVDMLINDATVAATSGTPKPTTFSTVVWNVADTYTDPVNCVFKNNKGCHIYSIEVAPAGASGIQDVNAAAKMFNGGVYSINGVKVRNAGESLDGLKGLYIINGKKVVLK